MENITPIMEPVIELGCGTPSPLSTIERFFEKVFNIPEIGTMCKSPDYDTIHLYMTITFATIGLILIASIVAIILLSKKTKKEKNVKI